jgi:LmbE family N-acetylglucosaminyl deacetylase
VIVLFSIIVLVLIVWLTGFFIANDFSVPTQKIGPYKNVLIIFPHADDEVVNAGGFIHALSRQKSKVTLGILTKGEKGTPDGHLDPQLKNIRVEEGEKSSRILGVTKVIQEDFGDGELINKKEVLNQYIDKLIKKTQADLVVTYDLAGLYGHPDHITVSEVVTDLMKNTYKTTPLWYVSFPKKVLAMATLPEHMAKDPKFKNRRAYPTFKVSISLDISAKINALYAHKSQYQSFRSSLPLKFMPIWFFYTMPQFEYFSKGN